MKHLLQLAQPYLVGAAFSPNKQLEHQSMGCDMVVALPVATGLHQALFGANVHRPVGDMLAVRQIPGRTCALGEPVRTAFVQLPQVRQIGAVLALQSPGNWGYLHGLNERRVVAGCSSWQSKSPCSSPGLLGPDLVRLALERAHSAQHAVEVLTDLIARHGQGISPDSPDANGEDPDYIFLVADPCEAFAVEAAGQAWAVQEICQVRAASDTAVIRQDWYSLAPGLADRAMAQKLWQSDGSKFDFVGALSETPIGKSSALRRWGRATLLLEQQSGHIDAAFVRRLLSDHYEGTRYEVDPLEGPAPVTPLCQHAVRGASKATAASAVAQLPGDAAALAVYWIAFGPPCVNVHFPLILEGDLPPAFSGMPAPIWTRSQQLAAHLADEPRQWRSVRRSLSTLQARFDQDCEEFLSEATSLKQRGDHVELRRLATSLMQSNVERFEQSLQAILGSRPNAAALSAAAFDGVADF